MMATLSRTLGGYFAFESQSPEELAAVVRSEEFAPVRKEVLARLKGAPLPKGFFELVLKQLHGLLDIDLRAILLNAWMRSDTLREHVDQKELSEDEALLLRLAEHTITSEHAPALKPSVNNVPLGEIRFTVKLELILDGVILKIQNGRIMEFIIGSCEGKGELKCGDASIVEKELEAVALEGTVDLGEGIPFYFDMDEINGALTAASVAT